MEFYTNFHTHCTYCDGKSKLEEIILKAIKQNLRFLGFSSHFPVRTEKHNFFWTMKPENIRNYLDDLEELALKYQDKIYLFKGFETDFIEGELIPNREIKDKYNLDYQIASVHYLTNFASGKLFCADSHLEDYQRALAELYDNDYRKIVEHYLRNSEMMISQGEFEVIGHLDLFKKSLAKINPEYLKEGWYLDRMNDILNLIKKKDIIIEINTGGKARGYTDDFYPALEILKMAQAKDIKIMINSDSHHKDTLLAHFEEAYNYAITAGFKEIYYFTKKGLDRQAL